MRRLNRLRAPEQRRHFRKTTTLAHEMLAELPQRLPPGCQVYVLFDSWDAANRLLTCCRRQHWHVVCAITSTSEAGRQDALAMAPSAQASAVSARTAARYRPTAADVSGADAAGQLNTLPFAVWVLISQRHHRDKHPKYFLCTALSLSAQQILRIDQKRWPIEVDNFYVKQHLGLADFRVQSYEATEQWCAIVFLAMVFLHWRLNHAHAKEPWHSLADVVRQHRYEHARTLREMACQEAVKLNDYLPVLKRFLCQPT